MSAPNTRVQRTRSSPSPPHSPLTRYPLGAGSKDHAGSSVVPSPEGHRPRPTPRHGHGAAEIEVDSPVTVVVLRSD